VGTLKSVTSVSALILLESHVLRQDVSGHNFVDELGAHVLFALVG
jgi:hypothetical protein